MYTSSTSISYFIVEWWRKTQSSTNAAKNCVVKRAIAVQHLIQRSSVSSSRTTAHSAFYGFLQSSNISFSVLQFLPIDQRLIQRSTVHPSRPTSHSVFLRFFQSSNVLLSILQFPSSHPTSLSAFYSFPPVDQRLVQHSTIPSSRPTSHSAF